MQCGIVDTHLNSIPGKVFSFIHFVMDPVDRERKSETEGKRDSRDRDERGRWEVKKIDER